MVVCGTDHDGSRCDAAALLNLLPRCFDHASRDHDGVCTDQRHPGLAIIKNDGPHFARVVKSGEVSGKVISGILHTNVGSDVAFGETGLEELLVGRQFYLAEILRNKRRRIERGSDGGCGGLSRGKPRDAEGQSRYGVLLEEVSSVHVFLSGRIGC
jgi:hypothetical protein